MEWKKYFKKRAKRKPKEQLVRAISFCVSKENALDLGSGTMIESKFLARKGFEVVAIDNSLDVKKYTKNISKKIKFKNISFQEYDYPKNTFDLINAQFSLPFHGKKNFDYFIRKIINSLKPKGIFVGQFFGINDSWNDKKSKLAFHTRQKATKLLGSLDIIEFIEKQGDGKTASGNLKHWHVFHFIAQKR